MRNIKIRVEIKQKNKNKNKNNKKNNKKNHWIIPPDLIIGLHKRYDD
jgi:hypothetical protein